MNELIKLDFMLFENRVQSYYFFREPKPFFFVIIYRDRTVFLTFNDN